MHQDQQQHVMYPVAKPGIDYFTVAQLVTTCTRRMCGACIFNPYVMRHCGAKPARTRPSGAGPDPDQPSVRPQSDKNSFYLLYAEVYV
jgi:hypothetical protein